MNAKEYRFFLKEHIDIIFACSHRQNWTSGAQKCTFMTPKCIMV